MLHFQMGYNEVTTCCQYMLRLSMEIPRVLIDHIGRLVPYMDSGGSWMCWECV